MGNSFSNHSETITGGLTGDEQDLSSWLAPISTRNGTLSKELRVEEANVCGLLAVRNSPRLDPGFPYSYHMAGRGTQVPK